MSTSVSLELNESHVASLAALFASSSSSSPISLEAVLCSLARKRQLTIENGKPRLVRITVTGSSLLELFESFRVVIITTTWPVSRDMIADRLLLPPCLTEQRLVITDTTPHPHHLSPEWLRREGTNCPRCWSDSVEWVTVRNFVPFLVPFCSMGLERAIPPTRFDSEFPLQHLCLRTLCIERFVCLVYK